jgi:hypothetical protein
VGSGKDDGYEGQEFGCDCVGEIHELESSVIACWGFGTSSALVTVRCV